MRDGKHAKICSKGGKEYAGATIRTGARPTSQFVRLVAFSSIVTGQLEELAEGDALAVKGELKVAAYLDKAGEPKPSIEVVADGLLARTSRPQCTVRRLREWHAEDPGRARARAFRRAGRGRCG
jgi:hypothetical protein